MTPVLPLPHYIGLGHQHKVLRRVHALERRAGILSVTLATGFPWSDVPDVGANAIVVADGDQPLARAAADELASWIWQNRQLWYKPPVSVREPPSSRLPGRS